MREKNVKREFNKKTGISFIVLLVFIAISVTSINACGYFGLFGEASWKEEVLLHDGSKIIVKRWQKREGSHEPGQRPSVSDHLIIFKMPGTNETIKWKDEYSKEIGRSNFTLLAVHILKSTPYIITTPRLCLSYNKWGRPNPPYVIFKFDGKEWKRIEIAELPVEFKNINLVINSESHEEKLVNQGLASAETIKKLNSSLTQPEFKTIARTPMEGVGCEKMIYDGKYWHGFSGLEKLPSYEECVRVCKIINLKTEYCPCKEIFKHESKGGK